MRSTHDAGPKFWMCFGSPETNLNTRLAFRRVFEVYFFILRANFLQQFCSFIVLIVSTRCYDAQMDFKKQEKVHDVSADVLNIALLLCV